ncbi:Rabenosyn-5, partial [Pseudolycoriella hygida]
WTVKMSNPNLLDSDSNDQILEGFLCPICKLDLKTPDLLTTHVENSHSEDQDLLKSFKDMFLTATKKIRLFDESTDLGQTIDNASRNTLKSTFPQQSNYTPITRLQDVGTDLSHFSYFKSIRSVRLERYATETNKLIIRLHKLLTDRPSDSMQQKIHEQTVLITLVNPTVSTPSEQYEFHEDDSLRICEHCLSLLENRKDMQDSQLYRPPITVYYEKIVQLKKDIAPDLVMYSKIISSLFGGDSIFTLADASALRGKIGLVAEKIDALSKHILSLDYAHGSREESLKKSIRLACIKYIKDEMLALEALPQENLFLDFGSSSSAVTTIDNWSGRQADTRAMTTNDPLIEQINIIKGYIKQARDALRFEEVAILELNLRELQQEFYNRQQLEHLML